MDGNLVLSLFPGIGLLDMAFELEGFTVVRGPDVLWGGDIHRFHPPAGKFDGIIGGPPCQAFSSAGDLRRARSGKQINLIPEFERVVDEASPTWFIMENVRRAPLPRVDGYVVADYLVHNRWFGAEQMRKRRFSFGWAGDRRPLLIEPSLSRAQAVKRTVLASDGKRDGRGTNLPDRQHCLQAERFTFEQACVLQGLPGDFLSRAPFTKEGKYKVVGNGVPLPMGRAIAKAVMEATNGK